jgi:L-fuconolactonase
MVIDHLAKPRIRDRQLDDWLPQLRAAAACPNVYCKLSGMVTEADWRSWTPEDLKPYVDAALDCFGPQRLMFGSDWPVCELAAPYERVYQTLLELIAPLSTAERARILGGTAIEFYGLELPPK